MKFSLPLASERCLGIPPKQVNSNAMPGGFASVDHSEITTGSRLPIARKGSSCKNSLDQFSMHIGQSHVAAGPAIG